MRAEATEPMVWKDIALSISRIRFCRFVGRDRRDRSVDATLYLTILGLSSSALIFFRPVSTCHQVYRQGPGWTVENSQESNARILEYRTKIYQSEKVSGQKGFCRASFRNFRFLRDFRFLRFFPNFRFLRFCLDHDLLVRELLMLLLVRSSKVLLIFENSF